MTASPQVKLKPGDTIGILGGGQLGRMLAMAAARLGLRCQVFSPDPDSPAFDVVLNATCAEYADVEALELFANDVDVITYEFENVPAATAMVLAARRPVLRGLQDLLGRQHGAPRGQHHRSGGRHILEFIGDDVDVVGEQFQRLDVGIFRAGRVLHDVEGRRIRIR